MNYKQDKVIHMETHNQTVKRQRILKGIANQLVTCKGPSIRLTSDFSSETMQDGSGMTYSVS